MSKKVLGLDISSTTVGWCLLEIKYKKIKFIECGFIKPEKKGTLFQRLSSLKIEIIHLLDKYQPDEVSIEEITQFIPHFSTAHTIILLAVFNKMIGLTVFEYLQKEPFYYSVMTIRHGLKLTDKLPPKEDIPFLIEKFLKIKLPIRLKKTGSISAELYDQADAAAVALYHCYSITKQLDTIKKLRK